VDISVYFKIGLNEQQILNIKHDVETDSRVKSVDYVSADEALADFKNRHQNDATITQSLNELNDNPLPASLHIKAYNLEDYPAISNKLNDPQYRDFIAKVNFDDNRSIIDRLAKILKFIITFGVGLIVIFALIAVLVIFNTITLTIYNRKEEVEIMRLVGATNWYIRGPFLTEAILYSLFATIIAGLLFIPVFTKILPKIALFVNPQLTLFSQNVFNYWYLIILMLAVSLLLAVFSTLLAIRKYLKI
jgi:cell division transport system permease protein